ncbi:flagellar hook-basal body complex protein FliE [Clostridium sp. 'White wine YQ']|uniref:flagellar hook-basal body complex protein FliE n=1 Tax=Clostridium sp. 'White wine YQ' TaxID=3027474 RepID=UPI002365EF1B|nr:flagellar hook-basal body complex protein FliE [Clostridium sp. 'White wine YQ']MDD7794604.1 flagellar hook-basal body complex protein FliE [Clostridium sp. 'White wine YQ']
MKINSFIPNTDIFKSTEPTNTKTSTTGDDFLKVLKDKLQEVNDKQVNANNMTDAMVKGEDVNIEDVMLSQEEAKMSLDLAVQVRNKIVDAIQELNRMQI